MANHARSHRAPSNLDGEEEAKLMALRLSKPPEGYRGWTLRLLADQLLKLKAVEAISPETVRKVQKNGMTKRTIAYWAIPPEENAEFVAGREEVLET